MKLAETALCPKCKTPYKTSIWIRINLKEHPVCKRKLIDGSFFKRKCPHCGAESYLFNDVIVEDEDNSLLIFCSMNKSISDAMEKILAINKLKPEFKKYKNIRVVDSPDVLREKLRIFDAGRDDRVIELIKLELLNELSEKKMLKQVKDVLCWVEPNGDMTMDFFAEKNGELQAQSVLYDIFYKNYYEKILLQNKNESVINIDWAIDFIDSIE